jgi:hypothetical protein
LLLAAAVALPHPLPPPVLGDHLNLAAAFLTQTVQLDDATVKFEIW